ncbi:hypothetical protein DOTSEDRAFT_37222 [Dothistroma septosporum NZE10]|uniref:TNFR-Cys domain-containing protein n=1 Tax=Dothistroma septosporum (strain NZE10 / CBS 128990) TaxID=675120 RepID=N1PIG8_DOTSN|nr:hypothetical protein DOTSEDRAFT_37222 [Dothistroma septosporum NZE10]
MVRGIINLALGLLVCSSNVLANSACYSSELSKTYSHCSLPVLTHVGEFTSLMKLVGNDASVNSFCQSLPPSYRYNQNNCPQAMKKMAYDKVKSFCGCIKSMCMPTQCGYGSSKCPKAPCGNSCADLKTDSSNCGNCGVKLLKCQYGQTCQSSSCKQPCPYGKPDQCPDPNKYGALTCTNKQTDCENCGQCGSKCNNGQTCKNGKCVFKAPTCPADKPLSCTTGSTTTCVDPKSPDTCGSCTNKCTSPKTSCDGTTCTCPTETTTCGSLCCSSGQTCTAGKCVTPPPPCTPCGSYCCDTATELCYTVGNTHYCQPTSSTCTSTQTKCGNSCCDNASETCGSNQNCQPKVITPICSSTQTLCGTTCCDNTSQTCGSDLTCQPKITTPTCSSTQTLCGTTCCDNNSQTCASDMTCQPKVTTPTCSSTQTQCGTTCCNNDDQTCASDSTCQSKVDCMGMGPLCGSACCPSGNTCGPNNVCQAPGTCIATGSTQLCSRASTSLQCCSGLCASENSDTPFGTCYCEVTGGGCSADNNCCDGICSDGVCTSPTAPSGCKEGTTACGTSCVCGDNLTCDIPFATTCSAGTTACGTNCCSSSQTCSFDLTCEDTCSAGTTLCGINCCSSDQTCSSSLTCQDPAPTCGTGTTACGSNCLKSGVRHSRCHVPIGPDDVRISSYLQSARNVPMRLELGLLLEPM